MDRAHEQTKSIAYRRHTFQEIGGLDVPFA